ncbi:CrcB family protein [Methanimicrococcus sp. OttesenSCG-928-J09]|nr:CrcB family protein [Methanimicrococcus sp. OttesenSCG-928-J09]
MTGKAADIQTQQQPSLIQTSDSLFKTSFISVALGGFFGALTRAALFFAFSDWISLILVNILGSFLIGLIMFLPQTDTENQKNRNGNLNKNKSRNQNKNKINFRLFFGTGFFGAFTTFSFFILLPFLTAAPAEDLISFISLEMNVEFVALFFAFALILTIIGIAAVFLGKKAAEFFIEIKTKKQGEDRK